MSATTMTYRQPTNVEGWSATDTYRLARFACVMDPDSHTSPGADFLVRAAGDQAEILDRAAAGEDRSDVIHEIADGLVPIYFNDRAKVWTDLGLWGADLDTEDLYPANDTTVLDLMAVDLYAALINLLTTLTEPVATCAECGEEPTYKGLCDSCVHNARRSGWED